MRSPQRRLAVSAHLPEDISRSVLPATLTIGPNATPRCSLASSGVRRYFRWRAQKAAAVRRARTRRSRSALRDIRPNGIANRPDVQQIAGGIPEVSKLDRPDRRIELIRARPEAYYDVESRGPGRVSWRTICDEMSETTGVKMDAEILRQFVRRTMRRGRPRVPDEENLEAIVSFLCHPEIDLLSKEELNEPEIPYRFAQFLLDFLQPNHHTQIPPPPKGLDGTYRSIDDHLESHRVIDLRLDIKNGDHVIRISEHATSHDRQSGKNDAVPSSKESAQIIESEGWAVLAPDQNLFVFMKAKRYAHSFYYWTMGMDRNIQSSGPVNLLLLLRHDYPVQRNPVPGSFVELTEESDGGTCLLQFRKLSEVDIVK